MEVIIVAVAVKSDASMQKEIDPHPSRIREGIRGRLLDILYGDFIRFRRDPEMGR